MIRKATREDREVLHELYREFFTEQPPPPYFGDIIDDELREVDEIVEGGWAFLAELDGDEVAFALARPRQGTRGLLSDIYVRPHARRSGIATELMRAASAALREAGVTHVTLNVETDNAAARAVYARWGFKESSLTLAVSIDELGARLAGAPAGESFGSVHVQTDDAQAVTRAVGQFVPRLPGNSEGTSVAPPRNGWVAVYDELCDREPPLLQRLARELSDRMGAVVLSIGVERGEVVRFNLFERGRSVDEYLSVPTYYGDVAPGDVVALGANPTVVARLTGADRARFRTVARTAASPGELPPADELLAAIAQEMRIEGATHGYTGAAT